ncbi:hypothetical protein DM01DRAFT_306864 [Hesseltinella vesiculosa]|uniref:Nucleoporin protein Ndc1-Nup n=1 Tax=Hesseltinella vesiculosa TaxID=101127 RepID=A0A1X2G9C9_9FUNG|nr:hypothetical protein DM01DRAFT_306864 [Hesseltinella vesiculosa]
MRIIVTLAITSWAVTTLFALRPSNLFHVFTLPFSTGIGSLSFAMFFFSSVLAIVKTSQLALWKPRYLNGISELTASIRNLDHWLVTFAYAAMSCLLIRCYFLSIINDGYSSQLFTYPPGYRTFVREMNQEQLFVIYFSLLLGILYSYRRLLLDCNILRLSLVQPPTLTVLHQNLRPMAKQSMHYTFHILWISYFSFIIFNRVFYSLAAHLSAFVFGHILVSPVIGFHWYNLLFIFRVYLAGVYVVYGWECVDVLVNAAMSRMPIASSLYAPTTLECLHNGIQDSSDSFVRSTALAELAVISMKQAKQRKKIFADTDTWGSLSKALMDDLVNLCTRIKDEYTSTLPVTTNKFVLRPHIEKKPPPSIFTTVLLKEDDSIFYPYDDEEDNHELDDRLTAFDADDIPHHLPTDLIDAEPFLPDNPATAYVANLYHTLSRHFFNLKHVKRLTTITREQKMRALLFDTPDQIHIVQALGALSAASLKEDELGYVQFDLAKVLTVLLDTIKQLERLATSPPAPYMALPSIYDLASRAIPEVSMITRALEDAILGIVLEVGSDMKFIRLDKKHRSQLASYT